MNFDKEILRKLIQFERKTLIKGFFLAFFVSLPFTFLPVLFQDGDSELMQRVVERIPESVLYATLFGIAIVAAALYQNYERLKQKIAYYNYPAFKSLDFEFVIVGIHTLTADLDLVLRGYYQDIYYEIAIDIDMEDQKNTRLAIAPVSVGENMLEGDDIANELLNLLQKDFDVAKYGGYVEIFIDFEEVQLNNHQFISKYLGIISAILNKTSYIQRIIQN